MSLAALFSSAAFWLSAGRAFAHATEQGFILLLPTDLYIGAGIGAVALTVVALALVPPQFSQGVFGRIPLPSFRCSKILPDLTSAASAFLLLALVVMGFIGPHEPLSNPLTLFIWTVWWSAFLVVQGLCGDLWRWVNPWTGVVNLATGRRAGFLELPEWLGAVPGIAGLLAFGTFALAYPSPNDPRSLAFAVAAYWVVTLVGMIVFGAEQWLARCECFTMLLRMFAKLSPFRFAAKRPGCGIFGWSIYSSGPVPASQAVFTIAVLGLGSFDGLNETFWWLARIGVNPLEFPGRTAVVVETVLGLVGAVALLTGVFAACAWIGLRLAGIRSNEVAFNEAFGRLALSIIPIAFAYHFAHFLPAFLVNGQHALLSATDPFHSGADLLNLGQFYVTTGFFNTRDTVRAILLTQCFAIVLGHMLAVMLAHAIAVDLLGTTRRAAVSQIPLAVLMILYTLLSLWLLASPRGA